MKLSRRQISQLGMVGLMSTAGFGLSSCGSSKTLSKTSSDDMTKGVATAKITLIEYASPTCIHCADFDAEVMPELQKKYIDTGKVFFVFREFLTAPADTAAASVLLARCAGKDKYFGVLQSVWRSLPEMSLGMPNNNSRAVLESIAQSLGMSKDDFITCVTDEKALAQLNDKVQSYISDHQISQTPSFFINGKRLDYKGGGIAEFDEAFKPLLAAK
jgi:protein-disulfide isomerase